MSLVLTNATLIDCVDPNPVPEASVAIEDGRIAEITDGSRSPAGKNAHVIDLKRGLPASRPVGCPTSTLPMPPIPTSR